MKGNSAFGPLERAVGTWSVTGTHPALPGRTVRGKVTFERIEDGAFVRMHSRMVDPEFPEGVALFGTDGEHPGATMLYFDERGVSRRYDVTFQADGFTWSRDSDKLAQRFRVTIAAGGRSMEGVGEMKPEGEAWGADLCLSYVRVDG